jgi:hypothetical protein
MATRNTFPTEFQEQDRKARIAEEQVHSDDRARVENVIGWILLTAAGMTLMFSPSDLRAGGHFIEWMAGGIGIPGVVLVLLGWITRYRLEQEVRPKVE